MFRYKKYTFRLTKPEKAQRELISQYGDRDSCFREYGQNSHHIPKLSKAGWQFLSIHRKGKPYGRCWIKITSKTILITNIYSRLTNLGRVLEVMVPFVSHYNGTGEVTVMRGDCVDGVYTNQRRWYKIERKKK